MPTNVMFIPRIFSGNLPPKIKHPQRPEMLLSRVWVLFCSLAFLDPRVGHTMDVLPPLSLSSVILIDSSTESCPWPDVVYPGRAWSSSPACTWQLFLALFLSPGNSLVSSWCDHSMLASSLWLCGNSIGLFSLLQISWTLAPDALFQSQKVPNPFSIGCPQNHATGAADAP